jgi:hypothetical protein
MAFIAREAAQNMKLDALCLLFGYIDALCVFAIFAFAVAAIISRGADRYNCIGTGLLLVLVWGFINL